MNEIDATPQRIGIVGAGAIGGYFAAQLAEAGHEVSVLARGATLQALSTRGLMYSSGGHAPRRIALQAYGSCAAMGPQALVILALKAQALPELAAQLKPLIGPDTVIVSAGNGLPWWYFFAPDVRLSGMRLTSADPHRVIEHALPWQQILGGSVMASCSSPAPGVVVHHSGGRVVLGEPVPGISARAQAWAGVLSAAGVPTSVSADIRLDLWHKLLGNVCANPLSLLTSARTDQLLDDADVCRIIEQMMQECIELGKHLGLKTALEPRQRIEQTRQLGAIKTSMLQDLDAGRSVELDAILGAPLECAAKIGCPTPTMTLIFALARLRARQAGLYPA
ncbi:2-dehydropantoate 2-reductase [Paraburkholderia bonniea]|uniref:ketopantoate reductase family protein n=1 Tax=Paraburkholderia bonniea TaxID=2152891 RepID=UPI00257471ED|nr:2-dehydropantoate 2-reductase [Paraburkholderia bonniea]WJF90039.1 2-dehydropantoate 2-reductase [Paraburkholderia bonniea]WJF93353.1 2-dehydropantoate 2-reductase [Paraburkholderia bonniea]